jgi:hypothetical protein
MGKSFTQSFADRHGTNMLLPEELIRKRKRKVSTTKKFITVGCQKGKHYQCFSIKCSCDCHPRKGG